MHVAIAEDSALFRSGLTALLRALDCRVSLEASTGVELLHRLSADDLPDVVILDIGLPPTGRLEGLQTAADVRRRHPGVGLLILSAKLESAHVTALLSEGSSTYLGGGAGLGMQHKDRVADAAELLRTVRTVAAGGTVIDPGVMHEVLNQPLPRRLLGELGPRQREVLSLMAEGYSNGQISDKLFLSTKAVEKHSAQIFQVLQVHAEEGWNVRVRAAVLWLTNMPQELR